jgi:hypothetical protein
MSSLKRKRSITDELFADENAVESLQAPEGASPPPNNRFTFYNPRGETCEPQDTPFHIVQQISAFTELPIFPRSELTEIKQKIWRSHDGIGGNIPSYVNGFPRISYDLCNTKSTFTLNPELISKRSESRANVRHSVRNAVYMSEREKSKGIDIMRSFQMLTIAEKKEMLQHSHHWRNLQTETWGHYEFMTQFKKLIFTGRLCLSELGDMLSARRTRKTYQSYLKSKVSDRKREIKECHEVSEALEALCIAKVGISCHMDESEDAVQLVYLPQDDTDGIRWCHELTYSDGSIEHECNINLMLIKHTMFLDCKQNGLPCTNDSPDSCDAHMIIKAIALRAVGVRQLLDRTILIPGISQMCMDYLFLTIVA